jgi:hypothetical protein
MERGDEALNSFVMPGLVRVIHVFTAITRKKTWMAGTSAAITSAR